MKFINFAVLTIALLLVGCGGKLEGVYKTAPGNGGVTLAFKSNGKAVYMGMTEVDYEVDGKEVKLHMAGQQVLILKILDDGSIQFPLLGNMKKVPT